MSEVRERLTVSKQTTHTFYMEKFNVEEFNEVEIKGQYRV
jgi:hypothetical protein